MCSKTSKPKYQNIRIFYELIKFYGVLQHIHYKCKVKENEALLPISHYDDLLHKNRMKD